MTKDFDIILGGRSGNIIKIKSTKIFQSVGQNKKKNVRKIVYRINKKNLQIFLKIYYKISLFSLLILNGFYNHYHRHNAGAHQNLR